jgi:predicted dinucleotide-utilizing enzyme
MSASCIAGQTTAWDGTPAIFTLKPDPGAAHADTHRCIEATSVLAVRHAGRQAVFPAAVDLVVRGISAMWDDQLASKLA